MSITFYSKVNIEIYVNKMITLVKMMFGIFLFGG